MLPAQKGRHVVEQRKPLTKLLVEKTPARPGRDVFLWDTKVPGFGARIYPPRTDGGPTKRTYIFQYRTRARQQRRIVLGVHGPITIDAARSMAADHYEAVRKGRDPAYDQQLTDKQEPTTIERVVDEFMLRHMEGKKRAPSYIVDTRRIFENHVLPRWRGRDLRSIARRDVIELLDAIVDEGKLVAANRTLAAIRKLFNWALQRGLIEATPVALVEMPAKETRRERTLAADEIRALWPCADALGYPFGPFFKMALATGQRREEVASMRWQDISEAERTWTLPSEMTKPGRAHVVPLSPLAIGILAKTKVTAIRLGTGQGGGLGDYVFTTRGDRPISGYSKAKARLDNAVTGVRATDKIPALEPWTIHDLRRTVGTGLGKLGVPRFVIARVLNHADSSVTGIYDRHEYLDEKRRALNAWGELLTDLIVAPSAEVVSLRTAVTTR
jgi:integrase